MSHVQASDNAPASDPTPAAAPGAEARGTAPRNGGRRGPTLTAGDPVVALLAVAQRALDVPIVRLAAAPACTIAGGAEEARAWFAVGDPVGEALVAEVHAVGGPLCIEDTRAAPPFRGTVVLDGMRAMACLAVPVRGAEGATVAALCALVGEPRWWTDRDAALLGAIATAIGALALAAPPQMPVAAAPVVQTPAAEPRGTNGGRAANVTASAARPVGPGPLLGSSADVLNPIAQLAGGIAHNFNNQLTIVSANAELLRDSLRQLDGPAHVRAGALAEVEAITRAARQASLLTWELLAYGRTLPLAAERLDLHEHLATIEPRLRADTTTDVALELTLAAPRPHVQMDPAHLEHILTELVDNARHAMPTGGRLCVRTERVQLDAPLAGTPDEVPAGAWVVLSVIDTGVGIAPEAIGRIFQPFFSTYDVGHGSGLGLAAVHGIVAQSGGRCTVESAPSEGTVVRLWLPESAA